MARQRPRRAALAQRYEGIFLHAYDTLPELEALVGDWVERYNQWRPHTANDGQTAWQAYRGVLPLLERDLISGGDSAREFGNLSASASSQPNSRLAA